ncbi:hypothetical protein QA600_00785 [Natronococcus sp. A-GB1]|uniref:hypothetical protein n=1 Tax=Natronococcus sp. A-GB1 TaxID=3037648 RepID=UPI00241D9EC2|nr:hypothetical protein [Natronococcus sp. A-GB1]MDG5757877.1 hypothetical protein [Natronococcus sp. A-GB1]
MKFSRSPVERVCYESRLETPCGSDGTQDDAVTRHLSIRDVRESRDEELAAMFEWFNELPIDELQADHDVDFHRFEDYLERAW